MKWEINDNLYIDTKVYSTHVHTHTHTHKAMPILKSKKISELVELFGNKNFRVTECVLTPFSAVCFGIFLLGFYSARMNQSHPRDTLIYSGIVTASHTCTLKLD